jgi:hypothetical protein
MIFYGLLYLIGLAAAITFIFSRFLKARGPWGSFWTFFSITLLGALTAYLWVAPMGPELGDVYWLPPLVVGVLIAFLLAATSPPAPPLTRIDEPDDEITTDTSTATAIAVGNFFWFVLIFLIILVAIGYFNNVQ